MKPADPAGVCWYFTTRDGAASGIFAASSHDDARAKLPAGAELHGPFATEAGAREQVRGLTLSAPLRRGKRGAS